MSNTASYKAHKQATGYNPRNEQYAAEMEYKGRQKVEQAVKKIWNGAFHFYPNTNQMDEWDGYIVNTKKQFIFAYVEIKFRNHTSTEFDSMMIQKKKYDALRKIAKEKNKRVWLITVWSDDVLWFQAIDKRTTYPESFKPDAELQEHVKNKGAMVLLPFIKDVDFKYVVNTVNYLR